MEGLTFSENYYKARVQKALAGLGPMPRRPPLTNPYTENLLRREQVHWRARATWVRERLRKVLALKMVLEKEQRILAGITPQNVKKAMVAELHVAISEHLAGRAKTIVQGVNQMWYNPRARYVLSHLGLDIPQRIDQRRFEGQPKYHF